MVKLLPLHHPVRILEDMCVADQLTGGRLDFGVGSGVAPIEHAWFGSDWTERRERFEDTLGIICRALATGEISSEGSAYHDFPTVPLATRPLQDPIPFWYPGNPATAGRYGMSLMWPGPIDRQAYDVYVDAWNEHKGDTLRVRRPGLAAAGRLHDDRRDRPDGDRGARHRPPRRWTGSSVAPRPCTTTTA